MQNRIVTILFLSIALSLFLCSCATVFPAYKISQDATTEQTNTDEKLLVSGELKLNRLKGIHSWKLALFDLFFNRESNIYEWNGTIQLNSELIPLTFEIICNEGINAEQGILVGMQNLTCKEVSFDLKESLDNRSMLPMEEFGYFITGGKVYFVYVATKDGLGGANIMHNPTNVKFIIECESSNRVCEIYTDKKILDKYKLKGEFSDSAEDETIKLLSGITASFYKAALDCMNVKV